MRGLVFYITIINTLTLVNPSMILCQGTSTSSQQHSVLSLSNNLEQLAQILPGIYDNSAQHKALPKDFHHIKMNTNRIWSDRDDAVWLYVEQSLYDLPEDPHHQWVYKIFRGERDTLVSEVYRLEDPEAAIGQGQQQEFWKTLHPDKLLPREGCALYFVRRCNGYFTGSTRGDQCCSNLGSSSFLQVQMTVGLNTFKIWEEGFDTQKKKVWGAEKGAYRYERQATAP